MERIVTCSSIAGDPRRRLGLAMAYHWNFAPLLANADVLWLGALGTLRLFAICATVGLSLGLVVGLARTAHSKAVYLAATAFVEFFRNTPVLVQILWFYFALPILLPFEISPLSAAALGISLNSAAFSAEIYRGGIESIERGQAEAARALGMTHAQAMRRIILPQALRRMLPALTNRGIEIFKMTTLASAVAYVELLQEGKLLASLNFNPIETYTVIAVVFFLCLFPLVQATYALERRLGRADA
jgi:polar amino acid transport system permease protein